MMPLVCILSSVAHVKRPFHSRIQILIINVCAPGWKVLQMCS